MTIQHLITGRASNNLKTFFLMVSFLVTVVLLGFLLSIMTGNVFSLYTAIIFSLGINFFSYFFSDKIALKYSGAIKADEEKYSELHQIVEVLSQKAHIPKPDVYVINDPGPNAFATGRNEYHSAVAVTTGLVAMMNKHELEGVIAHELAHIKNKDILIMSVVVVLSGILSMFANMFLLRSFGLGGSKENNTITFIVTVIAFIVLPIAATIVRLAISRKREFVADASGGLITGYPESLASALQKISGYAQPLQNASPATAHMYISCPFGGIKKQTFFQKLFMTHPPVEERIKMLTRE